MITFLDNQTWKQADLAGNAQFIETGGAIYIVSNVRADNTFVVLKSTSRYLGDVFVTKATYTFPTPNDQFAPCIAYDSVTQLIHIVGLQNNATNSRLVDFVRFTFDTVGNTLSSPTVLATAGRIRSGFDIVVLGNSHTVIGVILTDPLTPSLSLPGHSLVIFELNNVGATISTTQLLNSPDRAADPSTLTTFNSLSLISPDGVNVELYHEQHPRVITFTDQLFQILYTLRDNTSTWGSPTVIEPFSGRYSDDRLTVIPDAVGGRYLSQTYYNQFNIPEGIVGNLLLGHLQSGPNWSAITTYTAGNIVNVGGVSYTAITNVAPNLNHNPTTSPSFWQLTTWFFHIIPGTFSQSIIESTLTLSATQGVKVAYLVADLLTGQVSGPAYPMKLASMDLSTLGLTDIPGFYNNLAFTWLRGSKTPIDDATGWGVVAEQQTINPVTDVPVYVSGLNVPPVARILPTSATVLRGQPFTFSATTSTDGDGDPIIYAWSENDQDLINVTLLPTLDGTHATLTVQQNVGGAARSFVVAVAEADTQPLKTVSSVALTSNVLTVLVPNTFSPGDQVGFLRMQQASFLNGQIVTVSTASSTQFTAPFTAPDYGPTGDVGQVGVVRHPPSEISNIALAGGTLTVTAPNTFVVGNQVMLYSIPVGLGNVGSVLNDQIVTVATQIGGGPIYTGFTASFTVPAWSAVVDYVPGNLVLQGGVYYICILENINQTPPNATYWAVYTTSAQTGLVIDQPQWAIATITVPFNPAPAISFPINPIHAARNSEVTITPIITGANDPDDTTVYTWIQTAGTPVQSVGGFFSPTFSFLTNGVMVEGETLTFELTVNDGVNPADVQSVNVIVNPYAYPITSVAAAIGNNTTYTGSGLGLPVNSLAGLHVNFFQFAQAANNGIFLVVSNTANTITVVNPAGVSDTTGFGFDADVHRLARAIWTTDGTLPAKINVRNTSQIWGSLNVSGIYTDLSNIKRNSILDGSERYLIISPASTLVYGGISPSIGLLRRLLVPKGFVTLDAFQTEVDYTLVLDDTNKIYRFTTAPLINTDNPDVTIDLSVIAPNMTFTKITSTVSFADARVLALSGPQGTLLLQVRSSTLGVEGFLAITTTSNLLYGANNVLWIRTTNVQNIRSGRVLLGTVDNNGQSYETLIDLTHGTILGNWDKSKLINQFVNSGEFLFGSVNTYSGRPQAPFLEPPFVLGGLIYLAWLVTNPQLLTGYEIYWSTDSGTTFNLLQTVNSGAIQVAPLSLALSGTYQFKIRSTSSDGFSNFSNIQVYPTTLTGFGFNFGFNFGL